MIFIACVYLSLLFLLKSDSLEERKRERRKKTERENERETGKKKKQNESNPLFSVMRTRVRIYLFYDLQTSLLLFLIDYFKAKHIH
jgi:hypothetical protein